MSKEHGGLYGNVLHPGEENGRQSFTTWVEQIRVKMWTGGGMFVLSEVSLLSVDLKEAFSANELWEISARVTLASTSMQVIEPVHGSLEQLTCPS